MSRDHTVGKSCDTNLSNKTSNHIVARLTIAKR